MKRNLYLLLLSVLIISGVAFTISCSFYSNPATQTTNQPATIAPGSNTAVTIENFAFSPSTVTINAGATVTWTNKDSAAHTVVFTSGNLLNSGDLAKGGTFSFTFSQKGTFEYRCGIHPNMTGKIIVQ
jgi:plastocyanin